MQQILTEIKAYVKICCFTFNKKMFYNNKDYIN